MSEPIKITGSKLTFDVDGNQWQMGLVESMQKMHEISTRCQEEKKVNFEHLDEFRVWVNGIGGPLLDKDQASELWDWLEVEYLKKKMRHSENTQTIAKSLPRSGG